jgi:predicted  nucleic acid-binding Zn-ribbon protein
MEPVTIEATEVQTPIVKLQSEIEQVTEHISTLKEQSSKLQDMVEYHSLIREILIDGLKKLKAGEEVDEDIMQLEFALPE